MPIEAGGRGWRGSTVPGWRPATGSTAPPACSFCGKPAPGPGGFVAGNGGIGICADCVTKTSRVLETGKAEATPVCAVKPVPADVTAAACSFCTKRREQVDGLALAAGTGAGGVTICTECLALCTEIIAG